MILHSHQTQTLGELTRILGNSGPFCEMQDALSCALQISGSTVDNFNFI